MFTQFFGNFLLNKGVVTKEQLLEAMADQKTARLKLGTLAIYEGYLTASEVEKIHILQTHVDKKFGEIAVDEGFLTQEQVDSLMQAQSPDYLLFGQTLIDKGILNSKKFEDALTEYQSQYELESMDSDNETDDEITSLLENFYVFDEGKDTANYINYLKLFFNNLVRFIGKDFTPLDVTVLPEFATSCCTSQCIAGDVEMFTAVDMDVSTSIEFASRYMNKEMDEYNEYVLASVEDFLNLHNGLYSVNLSNEQDVEVDLEPLEQHANTIITLDNPIYYVPVIFPFGTMSLLFSIK